VSGRDDDLCWRVERALQLAWPALAQQACGDWLARFAPGVSRRSNSANPLRAEFSDLAGDIAACEALYRARSAPALFRVPAIVAPAADETLERLNYAVEGETITLFSDLAPSAARDLGATIMHWPNADWLAAMAALQGQSPEQAAVYRGVVESVAISIGFADLRADGEWAALAFGAVHDALLCCESVVVDVRRRGRGHGRAMMKALLAWGAEQGARAVCLQVAADNAAALALYRGLGMTTELYRYHYRRAPGI
jgi:ribosomal protein S18 acetylase RimI-like enzyme